MFDNLKNLASMMGQARELRQKMEDLAQELGRKTVEADAGAGAVRVTMNGRFEVLRVELDRAMIATLAGQGGPADQAMVEELLASAMNAALKKVQEVVRQETLRVTGLNLPGMG